ncbi:MAG: PhoH family protein [Bradymonadales bacterium]|nr:PhoH family protein [Bradymonadales bacterium]
MKKNFILDTNVLLHDPRAILKFDDNTVIIPIYVIEEIDQFKKELSDLGRNARQASRYLDDFREQGNLGVGIRLPSGGILRVLFTSKRISDEFVRPQRTDNLILAVALDVQEREPDRPTIIVTKDTNLRVRADALGLKAENYEAGTVSIENLYSGSSELTVDKEVVDQLFQKGSISFDFESYAHKLEQENGGIGEVAGNLVRNGNGGLFQPNQYVLLRDDSNVNHTALGRINNDVNGILALRSLNGNGVWGIRPRNKEQYYCLDCLLDDSVQLVTLVGKAGTGKTLLAIAAALQKTLEEHQFHRILVSRPIFPLGRDIGFLPGDVEEKLNPWMQPIHDNLELLMGLSRADRKAGRSYRELFEMGVLQIEPLTYIRGRSIPNQFLIVDEAQNLTPHEVKTIITRVGEGTKLVFTGDPYQIDHPYLDSQSNGLTYIVTRFRGQPIAATVTLYKGERSQLAELAANLL